MIVLHFWATGEKQYINAVTSPTVIPADSPFKKRLADFWYAANKSLWSLAAINHALQTGELVHTAAAVSALFSNHHILSYFILSELEFVSEAAHSVSRDLPPEIQWTTTMSQCRVIVQPRSR